jgi:hypothetical protein
MIACAAKSLLHCARQTTAATAAYFRFVSNATVTKLLLKTYFLNASRFQKSQSIETATRQKSLRIIEHQIGHISRQQ